MKLLICLWLVALTSDIVIGQGHVNILESFASVQISAKLQRDADYAYSIIAEAPIPLKTCKEIGNNCENRTQFTNSVLKHLGFQPISFWLFKEGLIIGIEKSPGLEFRSTKCRLSWQYHVASGIIIKGVDKSDTLIYDPWTQGRLVTLREWTGSFLGTVPLYLLALTDNYEYYPSANNKLLLDRESWAKKLDNSTLQMYCGLSGITPNTKCDKPRFKEEISAMEERITQYLSTKGILLR